MSDDELTKELSDAGTGADDIENTEPEQAPKEARQTSGLLSTLITIVFSVGIVTAGAVYWYKNHHLPSHAALSAELAALTTHQATLEESLSALNSNSELGADLKALKAAQATLKTTLSTRLDEVATATQKTTDSQQKLQTSLANLYEKEDQSSLEWVLAEAEYLVLAANQRLALEGDINTAIAALRAADQRLSSAEHPDLIPIRDRIIEDATALEAVKLPDIEGLAIYLAKVIEQVKALPTKAVADSVEPFSSTKNLAQGTKNWRNVANAMWTDLVELVEVKDAALPDSVTFDPELRYFLEQNLRLELASARLSVLRRDGQNFRASVNLIKDMLNEFYETAETSVSSIIERLNEAEAYEFEPALPKITASLDVIRAYMKKNKTSGAAE